MTQQPEGPMEGPYRVVRGNHKEDHAIAYWKIVPDAGLPRVAVKQLADDWCAALNAAYAAGLAARPAPPPTGERPWERLEAVSVPATRSKYSWKVLGHYECGEVDLIADELLESHAVALADAYNAHRPASPATDAEAIAREAVQNIQRHGIERGQFNATDSTRIIADAIRKAMQ